MKVYGKGFIAFNLKKIKLPKKFLYMLQGSQIQIVKT